MLKPLIKLIRNDEKSIIENKDIFYKIIEQLGCKETQKVLFETPPIDEQTTYGQDGGDNSLGLSQS